MNHYEEKQAARKARYETRAEQANTQAQATYSRAQRMAEVIPFGQPILVGHHSEGRDRNTRARIHNTFDKAHSLQNKADHYTDKAATVGKGGISSDDPSAIEKLLAKVESLATNQERMKKANQVIRKHKADPQGQCRALVELGFSDEDAQSLITPDYAGRIGFAAYVLTNTNGNIRRIQLRIKQLQASQDRDPIRVQGAGYEYAEDVAENRAMFMFDGKPEKATRDILKQHGFRWSPTRSAWIRQLNSAAVWQAKEVMRLLDAAA